jgi:hypothetical protein
MKKTSSPSKFQKPNRCIHVSALFDVNIHLVDVIETASKIERYDRKEAKKTEQNATALAKCQR